MPKSMDNVERHLKRLRRMCAALPETTEKLSHGEPTFFVRKKVFAMFSNNHHNDGHIAVWLPAPPGIQTVLIEGSPEKFFKPPYVGVRGWIGVELDQVSDEELDFHLREAWRLVAPKRLEMVTATKTPTTKLTRASTRISKTVVARRRSRIVTLVESMPGATVTPCGGQHLSLEVAKKRFGYYLDSHHGDGRVALNCKAEPGANQALVDFAPKRFHIPAYLGSRGWVGLWIDLPNIDWDEVRSILVDAYCLTASRRLAAQLDSRSRRPGRVKHKSALRL